MSTLNEKQVRDAALNVVDEFLDNDIEYLTVTESADEFFSEGWTGVDEDGEPIEADVTPDTEDYSRIYEEATDIIRNLRNRTDLYYDN